MTKLCSLGGPRIAARLGVAMVSGVHEEVVLLPDTLL